MLVERNLSIFEKTFPSESAANALSHITQDTRAKAVFERAKLSPVERLKQIKLDSPDLRSRILNTHSNLAVMLANGFLQIEKFFGMKIQTCGMWVHKIH